MTGPGVVGESAGDRLQIPVARFLEPLEIRTVVGVPKGIAFTPADTMPDGE
jgi:hypothetical protein